MQGLLLIVRKSLAQHALSSTITVFSVALASGLVMAVFAVNRQAYEAFTGGPLGFDAVLGARGSKLQLVLNSVFHLETSPGNIPWKMYQEVRSYPGVTLAVPYALGDNYRGYRIVGTSSEFFERFEYQAGKRFQIQPHPEARFFDPARREAVVGSYVAERLGLEVGAFIHPYHDLVFDEKAKHPERYLVVGVLEPTNTPSDRVVWIPIEGVFRMSGHLLRGGGEEYQAQGGQTIPDEHKEVSAVMLKLDSDKTGFQLAQKINNQGKAGTLAFPLGQVMAELFLKLGWVNRILELVACLVVAVAAGSILASIYNTMNERRREFAILRALGARRLTVCSAIVLEAASIAALGSLGGFAVYGLILASAASVIRAQTGVILETLAPHPALWLTPAAMLVLGALAGLLPARKAYATPVAENLLPAT